ncbi:DUF3488 domain-containing protein [Acidipropionibacterium acidipropionici]|uniref:DUF3488 domain-containing protein n=1 Tax=Acidipropionibacterium acidipropionici TaxID=1748 RepID=UPI0009737187|nr:transglutaminaseTgpA domain-containing protein [Acidipropionibacterium acidipropionici]APZ10616.1 hypothetical protein BWX38_16690 [Acidipropionibacterium acidipropionici]
MDAQPVLRLRGLRIVAAPWRRGDRAGGLGVAVAIPALALSLVLGSVLPTFGSLDINSPRPRGSGPLQLADPTIDLQKNLNQQSNSVVLRYNTPSRTGEYLRLASLTRVNSSGWHVSPVNLSQDAPASVPGSTPPAPGAP